MSQRALSIVLFTLLTGCEGGEITAEYCFGGALPILVVYGVGGLAMTAIVAWMGIKMVRWGQLARASDASVDPSGTPLKEGTAVLRGHVCREEESAPAHVEIHQAGTQAEDSSGNVSHRWTEKDRRLVVRPFVMELLSGERVRVEPTQKAILADALDGVVRVNKAARILKAELTPGEALIATGRLVRHQVADGYRGTRDSWVLTSPGRGEEPMLLSTEPLGARFRARSRGAATAMGIALLGMVALHLAAGGFHLRLWQGESVPAETSHVRSWVTYDSDDNAHHHRLLTVQLPDGTEFAEEISSYSETRGAFVRLVPGMPDANSFGQTATLHTFVLVLHLLFPWLALLAFRLLTPKRWYEGRVQKSKGSGPLR